VAKDLRKNGKKINAQKKAIKLTREERLASALKKNIKLRKENKNNC
tara:strand:+ start:478 stop:615 length:138 start_codon:yes stop_codon:yes gene_type:complete